tara:strand:+ start:1023 stop:1499 length:477 start_codon:yes stop_codon:yes gene_type:complete
MVMDKDTNCPCLITNKGVNDIIVGKSDLKDVKQTFGKVKRKRVWRKGVEFDLFGNFDFYLEYDSIGKFETFREKYKRQQVVIIKLDSSSNCKSKNGVGIGASYFDLVKEFGEPERVYQQKTKSSKDYRLHIDYDKMTAIFTGSDSTKAKVETIEFFSY